VLFKHYAALRAWTGLDRLVPPNLDLLRHVEFAIFGFLPHRVVGSLSHALLDVFAAIPYLLHFAIPVLYPLYVAAFRPARRHDVFLFFWVFGWVNFVGGLIQFAMPTAPPWYCDTVILGHESNLVYVGAAEAAFARLDAQMPFSLFHTIYASSPLKFGAFPSLHVAWPSVLFFVGPFFSHGFGLFHVCWIAWASMYSQHHYAIDGLMGFSLAYVVYTMATRVWMPRALLRSARTWQLAQDAAWHRKGHMLPAVADTDRAPLLRVAVSV
jgi:hypothetical protein